MKMTKGRDKFEGRGGIGTILGVLCILCAALLLTMLYACTMYPDTESESSDPPIQETEPPTNSYGDKTDATNKSEGDDEKDALLLYYTSLVAKLEEEIKELKAENFLLSSGNNVEKPEDTNTNANETKLPFTYTLEKNGIVITSYTGTDKEVIIPSVIEGYPVVAIGERAFETARITSVVIPDSVTKIDWFAFYGCASLKKVVGSERIKEVGYGAFDGCPAVLVLICPADSYLAGYGKSFGIAVRSSMT